MARTVALVYNVRANGRSKREKREREREIEIERRTDDRLLARNDKPFAAL